MSPVSCTAHLPAEVPGAAGELGHLIEPDLHLGGAGRVERQQVTGFSRVISPADIFSPCHSATIGTCTSSNSGFHINFAAGAMAVSAPGSDGLSKRMSGSTVAYGKTS